MKAQIFADFLAEFTAPTTESCSKWVIFTDGSSNTRGGGDEVILENTEGLVIELSLRLGFPATNNQAEYEELITGLKLAQGLGVKNVQVKTDSQLVVSQVKGEAQEKDALLQKYLRTVREKTNKFESVDIVHILREQNTITDVLSKLASPRTTGVNHSFMKEILERPIYGKEVEAVVAMAERTQETWMTPIKMYIEKGKFPNNPGEEKMVK